MRILLTGAQGLLGSKLMDLAKEKDSVVIPTGLGDSDLPGYIPLDITDHQAVEELIEAIRPDAIINAAALTHVDACETQREKAYAVNTMAVRNLGWIARDMNIRIIHLSTDFVFDGTQGPYDESGPVNPLNYYGYTKLEGERNLLEQSGNYAILRTVLVYGYAPNLTRSNIVLWVRKSLMAGETIHLVNDQYRTPTWAEDLARACWLAAESNHRGVFNIAGGEFMNMYELGLQVAKAFDLDASLIQEAVTKEVKQAAIRPARTGLIIDKARQFLNYEPTPFAESLRVIRTQLPG